MATSKTKTKKKIQALDGFSRRIRELRKQKNLSQSQLGEIIGAHFTHISQYERGLSRPSIEKLKKLAEALGVTADYLMDGSTKEAAKASFEDREFLLMFKEIEKLPPEDKITIKRLIEAFLMKNKIQSMIHSG